MLESALETGIVHCLRFHAMLLFSIFPHPCSFPSSAQPLRLESSRDDDDFFFFTRVHFFAELNQHLMPIHNEPAFMKATLDFI